MSEGKDNLPSNWARITLGDLKPGRNESVDPRKAPGEIFEIYSVPAFPTGAPEMLNGAEIGSSKQRVEPGTVLLCGINPRINRVWVVSPANSKQQIASTEWIAFAPTPGIYAKYLSYFLQRNEIRDYLASNASGVGGSLMRVKGRTCSAIALPIAPANEQVRIVEEIEKQLTRRDAAIAALKRVQANLKRYRASVLKAACEGRLVPTEAELARREGRSYEPASVLLERVQTKSNQGSNHVAGMPDLPEGWSWTTLARLIAEGPQNGLYLPKTKYGSGTPILRIDDFQSHMSRASEQLRLVNANKEEVALYSLRPGDMVVNRVNSPSHLGKTLFVENKNVPALFESNMMRMRLHDAISSEYIAIYLSSTMGRTRLTARAKWAVNQASINQQDVGLTPIPLPPEEEQRRVAVEVSRQLSVLDEIQMELGANTNRADKLRQSVLRRAFEGKLAPQDASDEPASALLERIRATVIPDSAPVRAKDKKPTRRATVSKETANA